MTEVAMLVIGVLAGAGFIWLHGELKEARASGDAAHAKARELAAMALTTANVLESLNKQLHEHQQVIAKLCHKANVPFRSDD